MFIKRTARIKRVIRRIRKMRSIVNMVMIWLLSLFHRQPNPVHCIFSWTFWIIPAFTDYLWSKKGSTLKRTSALIAGDQVLSTKYWEKMSISKEKISIYQRYLKLFGQTVQSKGQHRLGGKRLHPWWEIEGSCTKKMPVNMSPEFNPI